MKLEIRVVRKYSGRVDRARLRRVAARAAHSVPAEATLYLTDDAEIRQLNKSFRATDAPTDVLAFPGVREDYLGDIVISYETAARQARQAHWRVADELDLLTVHGILHLIGYDDRTKRRRAEMWSKQEEILRKKIPSAASDLQSRGL